eukprot:351487-Chlamydomonas_euryale.AAC.6
MRGRLRRREFCCNNAHPRLGFLPYQVWCCGYHHTSVLRHVAQHQRDRAWNGAAKASRNCPQPAAGRTDGAAALTYKLAGEGAAVCAAAGAVHVLCPPPLRLTDSRARGCECLAPCPRHQPKHGPQHGMLSGRSRVRSRLGSPRSLRSQASTPIA